MTSAPPFPLDPDPARIRARFIREIDDILRAFRHTGRRFVMLVLAIAMAFTLVLLPVALHIAWRALRRNSDERTLMDALRRAREFGLRAVPTVAYPLMVNRMLRSPGDETAPGLVLISFDDAGSEDAPDMIRLATALSAGGTEGDAGKWSKEQRQFAADLMADEEYRHFRRRTIPREMTRGRTVYACDLMIQQGLLNNAHISDENPLLPCLAEPGDAGRLLVLPHWLASGDGAPATPAQKEQFTAALLYFEAFRRAHEKQGKA